MRMETLVNNGFETPHWLNEDHLSAHIEYHTSFLEVCDGLGFESLSLSPPRRVIL